MQKSKPWIFSYVIIFCLILVYSLILFGVREQFDEMPQAFILLLAIGMWIPGIFALIFKKIEKIDFPIFKKTNKTYYFLCPLIGFLLTVIIIVASLPFGQLNMESPYLDADSPKKLIMFWAFVIMSSYIAAISINMLAGLGEELYWRGYLWEKLKNKGALIANTIIGIAWGVWHLPVVILLGHNYPGAPIWGSVMMILFGLALSPIMTYYRLKGKSVAVASVFHGVLNATMPLTLGLFLRPNHLLIGATGVVGLVVFFGLSVVMGLYSQKTWKKLV